MLGKILFWDEQLSFDNTVACGSCHQARFGGADGRRAIGPGHDGRLGDYDDVFASAGIVHRNSQGVAVRDAVFGYGPQVGTRAAPSNFGGLWADSLFWDGRALTTFRDPVSGRVVIPSGGALESQSVAPILNPVEMADEDRSWSAIERKLAQAPPLALATHLPPDVAAAIAAHDSYPQLFAAAFGDPDITAVRVAFAIATYERTLVADQTPWDIWNETGRSAESSVARDLSVFQHAQCDDCHTPPLFTNNMFKNIGLREAYEDPGRGAVSGDDADDGRMRVPSLREVALQKSFMHSGEFTTLDQVLEFYATPRADRDKMPDGTPYRIVLDNRDISMLEDLLNNQLVDPRVAQERFPFDRPELRSEQLDLHAEAPPAPVGAHAASTGHWGVKIAWQSDRPSTADDYEVDRNGTVVAFVTHPYFIDGDAHGAVYHYRIYARNAATRESAPVTLWVVTRWAWLWLGGPLLAFAAGAQAVKRRRKRTFGERSATQ
ncbi:MAG TPA: cytochrome c peroxidase [Steroidobacteraceae bacterium]|nr:cytochrome c peroxidase [Steroidobacteraceae bacterium]